jgi:hypothetical protein
MVQRYAARLVNFFHAELVQLGRHFLRAATKVLQDLDLIA